ncbi:hypothetical protein Ancab_031415 [Ancistrocladus abbreviatus]
MACSAEHKLALVALTCTLVVAAPISVAAISCGVVESNLKPCVEVVNRHGKGPLVLCCKNLGKLFSMSKTKADRQRVCSCAIRYAETFRNLNWDLMGEVPAVCQVPAFFQFSPSTDCSRVR